jgi:hypothetical protein
LRLEKSQKNGKAFAKAAFLFGGTPVFLQNSLFFKTPFLQVLAVEIVKKLRFSAGRLYFRRPFA